MLYSASTAWRQGEQGRRENGSSDSAERSEPVLIGMDGVGMEQLLHLVREGHCPNMQRLIDGGAYREMRASAHASTCRVDHATLLGLAVHAQGDGLQHLPARKRIDDNDWGINTRLCRAEYLWNTIERAGKTPLLVKYEMSWPPTLSGKTGGAGGGHRPRDLQPRPDRRLPLLHRRAPGAGAGLRGLGFVDLGVARAPALRPRDASRGRTVIGLKGLPQSAREPRRDPHHRAYEALPPRPWGARARESLDPLRPGLRHLGRGLRPGAPDPLGTAGTPSATWPWGSGARTGPRRSASPGSR